LQSKIAPMSPVVQKILRFTLGLSIFALGTLLMYSLIGMKEPPSVIIPETLPRSVKSARVFNEDNEPRIPVEGKVEAWQRIDLFSEVNGVLNLGGKEFRDGVSFKEGEVILALDDSEARLSLKSTMAQFLQLTSGILSTIKVDFPDRIDEWEVYVNSIDINNTLQALPHPKSDRERFYIINRGVEASYHSIKSSEERLSKFKITAPFDGFVSTALVNPGSLVIGGQPLGVFVGIEDYEIKSSLNSDFLKYINEGDRVEFFFKGEVVAQGRLDRISSNVNPTTQSATVYFRLSSTNDSFELRDGIYLPGELIANGIENCFDVNVGLIEDDKLFSIEDGILVYSDVEILFQTYERAFVRGLEDGTMILSDQLSDAFEGMKVNPLLN
jgi:membrane fusion protein, multidrug efflux system